MKKQLKSLKQSNKEGINMVNNKTPEKSVTREQPARRRCKYCNGTHPRKEELCPAFGKTCNHCGRANRFANACLQKRNNPWQKPIHAIYENCSSDSGDSVMTVELVTPPEDIRSVQNTPTHQSQIFATMKIKGGKETKSQIDTGATCNILKKSKLNSTKYKRC
jgi:hypothetical protein